MHGEFLNIRGEKMSKRFGNITTARDLREDGVDAGAVRLLMYQVHYRQQLDLTDEALASAREGSRRLGEFQNRLLAARPEADAAPRWSRRPTGSGSGLTEALDDDLNAPARGGRAVQPSRRRATPRSTPGDARRAARRSRPGSGPKACWA